MTDALLRAMLTARPELKADGDAFDVQGDASVELLLTTQSGHVPLSKVTRVVLGEFITVSTQDADYLLPRERVAGLKVSTRAKDETRTGFRR